MEIPVIVTEVSFKIPADPDEKIPFCMTVQGHPKSTPMDRMVQFFLDELAIKARVTYHDGRPFQTITIANPVPANEPQINEIVRWMFEQVTACRNSPTAAGTPQQRIFTREVPAAATYREALAAAG